MQVELDGIVFDVFIEKKNNKNMYLRVKEDGIHITTSFFTTKGVILSFINSNSESILRMYKVLQRKQKKSLDFYYLGVRYDVVLLNTANKIEFAFDKVFVSDRKYLDIFLKKKSLEVFNERLDVCYNLFEEDIPYPKLMIRKMKRKWGYCNKREELIKLNFELIKYSINEIDYVIIHELCHFLEFNHSVRFWKYVKKYKSDYKQCQKILKEE